LLNYHKIQKQSVVATAGEPKLEKTAFKHGEWSGVTEAGISLLERAASSNK
jgi:hypothetical protein